MIRDSHTPKCWWHAMKAKKNNNQQALDCVRARLMLHIFHFFFQIFARLFLKCKRRKKTRCICVGWILFVCFTSKQQPFVIQRRRRMRKKNKKRVVCHLPSGFWSNDFVIDICDAHWAQRTSQMLDTCHWHQIMAPRCYYTALFFVCFVYEISPGSLLLTSPRLVVKRQMQQYHYGRSFSCKKNEFKNETLI